MLLYMPFLSYKYVTQICLFVCFITCIWFSPFFNPLWLRHQLKYWLKKVQSYFSSASFPQLDSRSFFFDIAPGAKSAVSSFVTLLAAAHALRNATRDAQPNRTILYAFFQGVGNGDSAMLRLPCCSTQLYSLFCSCLLYSRRPLTTLAVQEWCMICRTTSLSWIWIMFTQYWRLARYRLWTLLRKSISFAKLILTIRPITVYLIVFKFGSNRNRTEIIAVHFYLLFSVVRLA